MCWIGLSAFGQTSTSIVLGTLVPLRNPISVQQPKLRTRLLRRFALRREAARRGQGDHAQIARRAMRTYHRRCRKQLESR